MAAQTASTRLLIVAPYRDEDAFLATMAERLDAQVEVLNYRTNRVVSRGVLLRHATILLMAFRAFCKSRGKDAIVFGEQFVGLYYAFFCRLFFWVDVPACSLVLQLIYNRKRGWAGSCYRAAYRWLIASHALTCLVCHASLERAYYVSEFGSVASQKIFFVPFGRQVPLGRDRLPPIAGERYFFSGGTSNRDYRTLIDAFRGSSSRLVIACHRNDLKGLQLPENVTARHDAFGEAFEDCLEKSYAVILPIMNTDVSAGQLVLMDAMRAGKAAIVTAGSCMEDYVDQTCAVCVPALDANALRAAVDFLESDREACARLGKKARARYESRFTRAAFAERLCALMLRGTSAALANEAA